MPRTWAWVLTEDRLLQRIVLKLWVTLRDRYEPIDSSLWKDASDGGRVRKTPEDLAEERAKEERQREDYERRKAEFEKRAAEESTKREAERQAEAERVKTKGQRALRRSEIARETPRPSIEALLR